MEKDFSSDDEKRKVSPKLESKAKTKNYDPSLSSEIVPPFLCAGLGMVMAGLLLDHVQSWLVFKLYPELYVLVPSLLGLKGNLEMTLASRLSTLANLGTLNDWQMVKRVTRANLALLQVQGIVVGAIASSIPITIGYITDQNSLSGNKSLLLLTSSVVTASLASLVLGIVMILVILVSLRFKINPDNVATPIAASLGDLITLFLLATSAASTLNMIRSRSFAPTMVLGFYMVVTPLLYSEAKNLAQTREILTKGWLPVLSAMAISSMGGKILNVAIVKYPDMASYQPVINGVAGNLVAVQASRISTSLHQTFKMGELPHSLEPRNLVGLKATFGFHDEYGSHARTARFLLTLVIPGHLFFNSIIYLLQSKEDFNQLSVFFVLSYLLSTLVQVGILLHLANYLVHYLWRSGIDPDNASVPYLTALGDLLGGAFLALVFILNQR